MSSVEVGKLILLVFFRFLLVESREKYPGSVCVCGRGGGYSPANRPSILLQHYHKINKDT